MGRSCTDLWTNIHYVLKMIVLGFLLAVNYFVLDSYSKFHRFYPFGNGHFFAALLNIVILLYAYTWFDSSMIWEACMIISTILMLIVSTFAFTYDYYHEDEYVAELHLEKYLPYDTESFAISAGLTTASIVVLMFDLIELLLQVNGKRFLSRVTMHVIRPMMTGGGRGGRGGD